MSYATVFYRNGSGGTFIRKILTKLFLNSISTDIPYSRYGSAHVGSGDWHNVCMEHDFRLIPKVLNTNQSVLVITQSTNREFFARSLNQVMKWGFEKQSYSKKNIESFSYINHLINDYLGQGYNAITETISKNRFNPKYLNICMYFGANYLKNENTNLLMPHEELLSLSTEVELSLLKSCITMPYQCILDHDTETLLNTIEKVIKKSLTEEQIRFVVRNFDNYIAKQNPMLMKDPEEYFNQLQIKAFAQLDEMKREYDLNACNNGQPML